MWCVVFASNNFTYSYIGTEDFSMFPILPPGSFVQCGRNEEQGGGRIVALGTRAADLLRGDPRRPYLLLVQHAQRRCHYSPAPSALSSCETDSAPRAGGGGAGTGGGSGYEVGRVARF